MKAEECKFLLDGIYRMWFRDGSDSLAAVGTLMNGRRWYSAVNKVTLNPRDVPSCNWCDVMKMELLIEREA